MHILMRPRANSTPPLQSHPAEAGVARPSTSSFRALVSTIRQPAPLLGAVLSSTITTNGITYSAALCWDGDLTSACASQDQVNAWLSLSVAPGHTIGIVAVHNVYGLPDIAPLLGMFEVWVGEYFGDTTSASAIRCGSEQYRSAHGDAPYEVYCGVADGTYVTIMQVGEPSARHLALAEVEIFVLLPPPSPPPQLPPPPPSRPASARSPPCAEPPASFPLPPSPSRSPSLPPPLPSLLMPTPPPSATPAPRRVHPLAPNVPSSSPPYGTDGSYPPPHAAVTLPPPTSLDGLNDNGPLSCLHSRSHTSRSSDSSASFQGVRCTLKVLPYAIGHLGAGEWAVALFALLSLACCCSFICAALGRCRWVSRCCRGQGDSESDNQRRRSSRRMEVEPNTRRGSLATWIWQKERAAVRAVVPSSEAAAASPTPSAHSTTCSDYSVP